MDEFLTIGGLLSLGVGITMLILATLLTLILIGLRVCHHPPTQYPRLLRIWKWSALMGALLLLVGSGLCGLKLHFYPFYLT